MKLQGWLAGLLLLGSGAALAQEPPEQVYQKLHRAMLAGNADEIMSYATAARKAELKNMPGRDATLKFMASMTPKAYAVNSRVFNPDGKTARLIASGMGEFMGSHSMMYGTVNFIREDGKWLVDKWEWGNQKPAAFPVSKPATPAVPATAAAAVATTPAQQAAAAPPEASKLEQQEARKKAREEAEVKRIAEAKAREEAERKAYEARWKDCVIKPVMSDDDLRKCGARIAR